MISLDVIKRYRRLLALSIAAILIGLSWSGVYYFSAGADSAQKYLNLWLIVAGVLTNLASTVIAFWAASLLFSKEDEQSQAELIRSAVAEAFNRTESLQSIVRTAVDQAVSNPQTMRQVRWDELIENAAEIDFVVQAWNGWAEQPQIRRALKQFFERGGHFRLHVYDPKTPAASKARAYLEARLNRAPSAIVGEIDGTSSGIEDAFHSATASSAVSTFTTYPMDRLNWYFATLFKGKELPGGGRARNVLVVSIYSHTPRSSPWAMPAIVIYPDLHDNLLQWFEGELEHLRTVSAPAPARGGRGRVEQ